MRLEYGSKVKIKEKKLWPSPPGFRFANAEGIVVKWVKFEEVMRDFGEDYICVKITKAKDEATPYVGMKLIFKTEDVELIDESAG